MMTTTLRVPIADAIEWGIDELVEEFYAAAEKAGGELVDDAEEVGAYEEFEFDLSADKVQALATKMLKRRKVKVTVTGDNEVTVEPTTPEPWVRALSQYQRPYDKAMRKLVRRLAEDDAWIAWWRSTGEKAVWFHQTDAPESGFFPDSETLSGALIHYAGLGPDFRPSKAQSKADAEALAEKNLRTIMDAVAEHVGKPHPEWQE